MSLEFIDFDDLERALMRSLQDHAWRYTGIMGLLPSRRAEAPAIARSEPCKPRRGMRRHQVVSPAAAVLEKFSGDPGADDVGTDILQSGAAATVPVESGHWVFATRQQRLAEDVQLICHDRVHNLAPAMCGLCA